MTIDPAPFLGPIAVTVAYTALYYWFQIRILLVKRRLDAEYRARGERLDRYFNEDRVLLAADRTQLNMLEHMPVFLSLLWVNAVFVSPLEATIAGGIYVAARAAYPFVMGPRLGRGVKGPIFLSTAPGYAVMLFLMVRPLVAALLA